VVGRGVVFVDEQLEEREYRPGADLLGGRGVGPVGHSPHSPHETDHDDDADGRDEGVHRLAGRQQLEHTQHADEDDAQQRPHPALEVPPPRPLGVHREERSQQVVVECREQVTRDEQVAPARQATHERRDALLVVPRQDPHRIRVEVDPLTEPIEALRGLRVGAVRTGRDP
jgi:hypothetical protein